MCFNIPFSEYQGKCGFMMRIARARKRGFGPYKGQPAHKHSRPAQLPATVRWQLAIGDDAAFLHVRPCFSRAFPCVCVAPMLGDAAAKSGADSAVETLGSPFNALGTVLILDAASVVNTQKTIDDHVVSWISDRDCSSVRASTGGAYCVDRPQPVPTAIRVSYCYQSLAKVDCYDRPVERDASRFSGTRIDRIPGARLP